MLQSIASLINRSRPLRCALCLAIFATAFAARLALLPLNASITFATFYPATALIFLLCGMRLGAVAVVLSLIAGLFAFSPPTWTWQVSEWAVISASTYLVSSAFIGWIIHRLQSTFAQLVQTSDDLRDLYEHSPCGYYSLDAQGRFLQANDVIRSWLGCAPLESLTGVAVTDFFTPEGKATFAANFPTFLAAGQIGPLEFDLVSRNGQVRRVVVSATAIKSHGKFVKSRSVMYDISELDRVRRELQRVNREQGIMLDNELIGIVKTRDRRAVWKNRALDLMFGYAPGELDNQPARLLYRDEESYQALGDAAYPVLAKGGIYRTQILMARKDGSPLWVDMSGVLLSNESGESMWLMLDITALKQRQEQVEQIALHDPLTGLANRTLLADRLRQAILQQKRQHQLLAVCFVDLDDFKTINDQFGHESGDRVLHEMALRLQAIVRGTDTVARLGGDEFVVILASLQSRDECLTLVQRLESAIAQPIELARHHSATISASVGVAFYPDDGTSPDTLLSRADQAMYEAKRVSKARGESSRKRAKKPAVDKQPG